MAATRLPADDIVTDILDRIALKIGILPKKIQCELEKEIRLDWGGERPYVAKSGETHRTELQARDALIRHEHERGEHIELLSRRYGLSPARIRQILARKNGLP